MDDRVVVVIQCAASKRPEAGCLRMENGQPVKFVARPAIAPLDAAYQYANPDGRDDAGKPWRDIVLAYNQAHRGTPETNPWGLLPAWKLYDNPVYARLASRYGVQNVYILSAGWGLMRADFLTPSYNITFSPSAEKFALRQSSDEYNDWNELPDDTTRPLVFFGGKSYVKLFCTLTARVKGPRYLFYNSSSPPDAPGCRIRKYETRTRTNWHYECAQAFLDCRVSIQP